MSELFTTLLQERWDKDKFVCIGLDSDVKKLPAGFRPKESLTQRQIAFNGEIIEATKRLAGAYKPNSGFYENAGPEGVKSLVECTNSVRSLAPRVPIIADLKRADIGNTNLGYVDFAFNWLGADAVTVHPYLGMEAMKPFLDRGDKGIIVLCRTSNPGAGEFQDRIVGITPEEAEKWELPPDTTMPLYQLVAYRVSREWNYNGNCAVVVGATYADVELKAVRQIVGDLPILIPGVGSQGGDLEKSVEHGINSNNQGIMINSSRGIIFASDGDDFAEAAYDETLKLHHGINRQISALAA